MILQLADNIAACTGGIHQTDKGGAKLHIGDVLGNITANTAVGVFHSTGISAAGNISTLGIALNVNEDSTDNNNAHDKILLYMCVISSS